MSERPDEPTAIDILRRDAEDFEREVGHVNRSIEDTEKRIVELRAKRDYLHLRRAESLAAAEFLTNSGFKVERNRDGVVTVSVDPVGEPR